MLRTLTSGLELDDDPRRVDVAAVHAFLSIESYWARARTAATVQRLVHEASRVVGLYDGLRQIGFARVVSDGVAIAYLADVYVLGPWRGRGLGFELVREAVERGPHRDLRWILHTADGHAFYEKFGFEPPSDRLLVRNP
ncbi:MAG: GNAT family N-acetyltransferase [Pseudonocardiaceae bacterium]|nr:GNAT family N-acetyltransferase [Pseudonocardiaceae bacterium]